MMNNATYSLFQEEGFVICIDCFKNDNFGEGKSKDDFRFNGFKGIGGGHGVEWTEAETLLLLESVLKHGDDWELVAQNVETKSRLDCILKLIELPFGDSMIGSVYRTGRSRDHDSEVKKGEQLQRPLAEPPEIVKSDDQCVQTERIEKIENGDQEHPLKRKRVDSLPSGGSSLMKQVPYFSCTWSFIY